MGQEGTPPPQHHQLQAKLLQGFANGGLALSLVVLALERGSSYSLPGQPLSHSRPSGPSICLVSLSPPQMMFRRPGGEVGGAMGLDLGAGNCRERRLWPQGLLWL